MFSKYRFGLLLLAAALVAVSTPGAAMADLVAGYSQSYYDAATTYNGTTGVWTNTGSDTAANATAANTSYFSLTTTPNGQSALANSSQLTDALLSFTRTAALGGNGFTMMGVTRCDYSVSNGDGKGPIAFGEADGYSGSGGASFTYTQEGKSMFATGGNSGSGRISTGSTWFNWGGDYGGGWYAWSVTVDRTSTIHWQLFDLATGGLAWEKDGGATSDNIVGIDESGVLFGKVDGTGGWKGAIADVLVYNSVLSSDDVDANVDYFVASYYTTGGDPGVRGGGGSTIPEPGTVVLLATGLLGLLAYAWRKRK